jgi:hypothetical protein
MQGLVSLLLLFGLCFAVERGVRELRGRDAATLLTKASWELSLNLGDRGGQAAAA